MWLFSIGNGAEIRPLEMGRKSPEQKRLFPSPGCDFHFLNLFCISHLEVVPPIECELLHVAFKAWMLLEGPVALYLIPNINLNEA